MSKGARPALGFLATLSVAVGTSAGCVETVRDSISTNVAPVAKAGDDQELSYEGELVSVTLDGSGSSDQDGKIVQYLWKNAALIDRYPISEDDAGSEDAGGASEEEMGDLGPNPDDVVKPKLELDQGAYAFVLWVKDDQGAVSLPDTVMVTVGSALSPAVQQCIDNSYPEIRDTCKLCTCENCPEAAMACEETCWALLRCIGENCPDATDTACIVGACGDFLGGASQATAVGECVRGCLDECTPEE